jgi:uncharacterized protein
VVVADTSAMLALLDRGDPHHTAFRRLYLENRHAWVLPWATLVEVDYLTATRLGARAQMAWFDDLVTGAYTVEWGRDEDLSAARTLAGKYGSLEMGLVDAVVMIVAERLRGDIATLDLRHFGAVAMKHSPRLLPRDLEPRVRARRR